MSDDFNEALDAASAVLPSGWELDVSGDRKRSVAVARLAGRGRRRLAVTAEGETPAAALLALVAKLQERPS